MQEKAKKLKCTTSKHDFPEQRLEVGEHNREVSSSAGPVILLSSKHLLLAAVKDWRQM